MKSIYIVKYKCKICGEIKLNCQMTLRKYVEPEMLVIGMKSFGMWKDICDKCHAKHTIKKFQKTTIKSRIK